MAPRQLLGIPPVCFDPIPGLGRRQARRDHLTDHAKLRQLPIQHVAGRAGLVTGAQLLDRVPQHIELAGHLTGYALLYAGPGQLVRLPAVPTEDWVLEVQLLGRPGQLLERPADWGDAVAVVSVRGSSPDEVRHRLDQLIERMLDELIVD